MFKTAARLPLEFIFLNPICLVLLKMMSVHSFMWLRRFKTFFFFFQNSDKVLYLESCDSQKSATLHRMKLLK
jgi:hypothetical protein